MATNDLRIEMATFFFPKKNSFKNQRPWTKIIKIELIGILVHLQEDIQENVKMLSN